MSEVKTSKSQMAPPQASSESTASLLRELVPHLRQNRTQLRQEWARRITDAKLLTAMSADEIFTEATAVYDQYVEAVETGTFEALQAYARNLSERIIPRGVETHEVVGIVLLLRDVLARSLFANSAGTPRDCAMANEAGKTVEASPLLGATVIVTGLSAEIARTLVNMGVDLAKMNTVGDLQGGIEGAEPLLGCKVIPSGDQTP